MPNLKWAHGFYAGIDPIASFALDDLAPRGVPLSNGRGAFSSSLAEHAMYAAMHFIKQVPRCMENRRTKTWDKFVMGEMKGLTLGLLGAGSIAQATAQLGRAFGMRTIALRRNARKEDAASSASCSARTTGRSCPRISAPSLSRATSSSVRSPARPRRATLRGAPSWPR